MNPADQDRERVLRAVESAWAQEAGVRAFALRYYPDHIDWRHGAWVVPVATGIQTGSAYELGRVLEHVQEIAESLSHLPVNVFLTHTLNGNGKH